MQFKTAQVLAVAGLATQLILPVAGQDFDDYEVDLYAREAYDDLDFDDFILDARDKTWAEQGLETAKTVVPYAANHVNFPEMKHNAILGLAGTILQNTPSPAQLAAQKARQQTPSARVRFEEHQAQQAKETQAHNAQRQSELNAQKQVMKESVAQSNRDMAAARERNAHPVQTALRDQKKIRSREILVRRMIEEMLDDMDMY